MNLASKVTIINELLGLEDNVNIGSALQRAKQEVGCKAEGNLNEQADALLRELTPM